MWISGIAWLGSCIKIINTPSFHVYTLGAVPVRNAYFGEGSGTILLDDVNCGGSESTLLNCTASQSTGNCSHSEDAGVRCAGMYVASPFIHIF